MKEAVRIIISMNLSGLIFMTLSLRFQWSKALWATINKKISAKLNIFIYIIFAALINLLLQWIIEVLGLPNHAVIFGISLGIYFAFSPTMGIQESA